MSVSDLSTVRCPIIRHTWVQAVTHRCRFLIIKYRSGAMRVVGPTSARNSPRSSKPIESGFPYPCGQWFPLGAIAATIHTRNDGFDSRWFGFGGQTVYTILSLFVECSTWCFESLPPAFTHLPKAVGGLVRLLPSWAQNSIVALSPL